MQSFGFPYLVKSKSQATACQWVPVGTRHIKEEKEKEKGNVSIALHVHICSSVLGMQGVLAYDDCLPSLSAEETHQCVWALSWTISHDTLDPMSSPLKLQSSRSHKFVLSLCLCCCFTLYLRASTNYVNLTISQVPSSVGQHCIKQLPKILALIFSSTNNKKINQITIECEKHTLLTSYCIHFLTNKISITQPMPQRYLTVLHKYVCLG